MNEESWEGWARPQVATAGKRQLLCPPPQFEGEIVVQTRMMIDPNAKTRRGGGKHLGIRRGEILEVIEFTSKEEMLCRDTKGKCESPVGGSLGRQAAQGGRRPHPPTRLSSQRAMCLEQLYCPCECQR